MPSQVSIIICTHNRDYLLKETLPSVFSQSVSMKDYGVVIVNNNSIDGTDDYLNTLINEYGNLQIVNETQVGLGFARNTGYKHTRSEWIIYLDDDAIIPNDFVEIALNTIKSNKYKCFGGVYTPWYRYGKPKWYKDHYASTIEYVQNDNLKDIAFASGGIFAIKKSVLEEFNGFPTNVGMKGNSISYGEETQLQIKMKKAGYEIGIIPDWQMSHLVNKYKLNIFWFIKNGFVTGRDAWIIYNENVTIKKIGKYSFHFIKDLIVLPFLNLSKLIKHKYFIHNWFIDSFQPIALNIGRVLGGIKLALSSK